MAQGKTGANEPGRKVKIKLFKDNGKYRDPLFVSVNNYRAAIPRGVEVEIPFFAAEVIRQSQEQDENTATMITELSESANATALN